MIKLRTENELLRRGPPALAAIAEEVQALIDEGELDAAHGALERGREAARRLRIDASRYEAAFSAQEARVDDLQLAYRAAAAKYAEAAGLVAPFDTQQQWDFLSNQAREFFKQGVNLKIILGKINTDSDKLLHGRSPFLWRSGDHVLAL